MVNTNQIEKAIEIALKAHAGQVDKGGDDYILHPLRLMMQMEDDESRIVAVLHDVVEDSEYTFENLLDEGFSSDVVNALRALTKKKDEVYEDFIARVKESSLATKVKIADLKDNSNLSRIKNPSEKDYERIDKYSRAINILENNGFLVETIKEKVDFISNEIDNIETSTEVRDEVKDVCENVSNILSQSQNSDDIISNDIFMEEIDKFHRIIEKVENNDKEKPVMMLLKCYVGDILYALSMSRR